MANDNSPRQVTVTSDNRPLSAVLTQLCPITLGSEKFWLGCTMHPLIVNVFPTILFLECTFLEKWA
ncbi:hypothetical protein I79_021863 [Cricetulus griseus]|uniref:Uncharacterized protein n=1 Tax=Cricetulus griseus TaxID=10029 RepID=G3IDS9_CRIGR|nr:hypothetical protein I79_021863 [Cricetulus griseus]